MLTLDHYRARVRRLERHYFAEVFDPGAAVPEDWAKILAADLRKPVFHITHAAAISRRLRRNYCWMFAILLLAWTIKITSSKLQKDGVQFEFVQSFQEMLANAALGPLPGGLVISVIALFYAWIAFATLRSWAGSGELAHGDVHV